MRAPEIVRSSRVSEYGVASEVWDSAIRPALIVVGPAVVARKLKLAARTARAWTARSRRPAEPRRVAQAIVAIAGEAGLALPSDENFRAEKICAELPWRVVAVQFSASRSRCSRSGSAACGRLPAQSGKPSRPCGGGPRSVRVSCGL